MREFMYFASAMLRIIPFFFLLLSLTSLRINGQVIRGLYVNRIDTLLGNKAAEQQLLSYLKYGQFNSVSFYSLYRMDFTDPQIRKDFRELIRKARKEYGISRFGAVSENLDGFTGNIHLYNADSLTLPEDRLDHYNIEFEFWSERATSDYYCSRYLQPNGYPCNPEGALLFVADMIDSLRGELTDFPGIELEMYVGWLTGEEAITIAGLVDRVLIAVYREMDEQGDIELYDFPAQRKRLEYLAAAGPVSIVPIFSSFTGSADDNLNSWLVAGHTVCEAWDHYVQGFAADTALPGRENIRMEGYQWFKYGSMPPVPQSLKLPAPIFGPDDLLMNQHAVFTVPFQSEASAFEWILSSPLESDRIYTAVPRLSVRLNEAGLHHLQVRSLGCGAVSPPARKSLLVRNIRISADTLLEQANPAGEFVFRIDSGGVNLFIPADKQGPFLIRAVSIRGTKYIHQTIDQPGVYQLPFNQPPDQHQILSLSILYPGGSFSEKISIFGPVER